jgi:PAS domain-containing protein
MPPRWLADWVETLGCGAVVIDDRGNVTLANRAVARMTAAAPHALLQSALDGWLQMEGHEPAGDHGAVRGMLTRADAEGVRCWWSAAGCPVGPAWRRANSFC